MEKAHIIVSVDKNNIMHIPVSKDKFVPGYVYYLLLAKNCVGARFQNEKRIYNIDELKGKEEWTDESK